MGGRRPEHRVRERGLGTAGRLARRGLVGDAIALSIVEGELVAAKPAFSGAMVADITCTSGVRLVSVRPGYCRCCHRDPTRRTSHRGRSRLAAVCASCLAGVTMMSRRSPAPTWSSGWVQASNRTSTKSFPPWLHCSTQFAATRKVTDNGWAPRSRQVGITGRSIYPAAVRGTGSQREVQPYGRGALGGGRSWPSTTIPMHRCSPSATSASWVTGMLSFLRSPRLYVTRRGPGSAADFRAYGPGRFRAGAHPPMSPARNVRRGPATPPRGHPLGDASVQMRRSR